MSKTATYTINAEEVTGRSVDDVAEEIEQLAHEICNCQDKAMVPQLASAIMHLAADIRVTTE